jgi:hypothetical protein
MLSNSIQASFLYCLQIVNMLLIIIIIIIIIIVIDTIITILTINVIGKLVYLERKRVLFIAFHKGILLIIKILIVLNMMKPSIYSVSSHNGSHDFNKWIDVVV